MFAFSWFITVVEEGNGFYIFMCMYGYDVPLHVLVLYMVVCSLSQDRRIDGEIQKSREKCELGIFHGVAKWTGHSLR